MKPDAASMSVKSLKGIGPARASLLARLGIETARDALYHIPFRYEDRRIVRRIGELAPGLMQTVVASVVDMRQRGPGGGGQGGRWGRGGGLRIFELAVSDGSGQLKATWFNQPYMARKFQAGDTVVLSGVVKGSSWGPSMDNPEADVLKGEGQDLSGSHLARIEPVYNTTEGLTMKQLRHAVHTVLDMCLPSLQETIPRDILDRMRLPGLRESLDHCHFPPLEADVPRLNSGTTPFQQRLAFEELFMMEAGFALMRQGKGREPGSSFAPPGRLAEALLAALPFKLTPAQGRVISEIRRDMAAPHPMNRLMQGDVGSGKTVVALIAMLTAVECGAQACLMAPTEILAGQHYMNIHPMAEALGLGCALLTGSSRDRPLEAIASGDIPIVVGTHALIQDSVEFKRLGLAVIDEQHKFGVRQRAELRRKAGRLRPDILIMTATPIPRTLALTLYGELDYSVIDELPPGRAPIETALYTERTKHLIYEELEREVREGGQCYVVYPAIEESEALPIKNAEQGAEGLRARFPGMRVGLIHGRMRQEEREGAMRAFKAAEVDILVSTTVIEVGVDVPNASLMLVVNAERFGLSQLHQLRGRVGRGRRKSRCLLLAYEPMGEDSRRRMRAMVSTTDGFRIAEEDLEIRGPGEFLGTRQSGIPDLRVANIVRDARLLEAAKREAFGLIERDPELKGSPALRHELEAFWRGRMELFKTR